MEVQEEGCLVVLSESTGTGTGTGTVSSPQLHASRALGSASSSLENDLRVAQEVVKLALAVAIGTSHGAYKFKKKPTGKVLRMDVIAEIHRRMPNCHMVMHGSSSVPKELIDIINQYGGEMPETYGVPISDIQEGIKHGVRKINVDTSTASPRFHRGTIRKVLSLEPGAFRPRATTSSPRASR